MSIAVRARSRDAYIATGKRLCESRRSSFPVPSHGPLPAALFTIAPGETVTAVTGVVVTTVPGKATRFGGPTSKDDVIYLLTYHGEGVYTAWVNGTVVRDFYITNFEQPDLPGAGYSACVRTQTCDGKVLSYPQKTWWVQLRNAKGQIGWTDQAQCFDGRDAFGDR
jgi:hypothetical protein